MKVLSLNSYQFILLKDVQIDSIKSSNIEQIFQLICKESFDLVCLEDSLPYKQILELASMIKIYNSDIKIIYHGFYPSKHFVEIFRGNNLIDCIIYHSSPKVFGNLLYAIKHKMRLSNVYGIVYKEDGTLVITPNLITIRACNDLPWDWNEKRA